MQYQRKEVDMDCFALARTMRALEELLLSRAIPQNEKDELRIAWQKARDACEENGCNLALC